MGKYNASGRIERKKEGVVVVVVVEEEEEEEDYSKPKQRTRWTLSVTARRRGRDALMNSRLPF